MMYLAVKHNGKSHNVQLPDESNLGDLFNLLKETTGVPIQAQKLIFNGKQISKEGSLPMHQSGIVSGGKLMLLGKKYDPSQEQSYKDIVNYETKVLLIETKYIKSVEEFDGIAKGYLDSSLEPEALKKLEKRTMSNNEELQRILESLDAVSILEDQTDIRQKRKSVITKIDKIMDQNEELLRKISDYRTNK